MITINKRLLMLSLSTLLLACATTPMGRTQFNIMPDNEVRQMGLQAFTNLKQKTPISNDAGINQFVQCVASAITREVGGDWEVVVFQDDSLNAFALPGNKIGVHTGLARLVDNQDQLATVLGHEVAHVLSNHSSERMSQEYALQQSMSLIQAVAAPQSALGQTAMGLLGVGAQYGVLLPYSRLHESEADLYGLKLMARAGFDPQQSIRLWQKMDQASKGQQPAEFLSTHPSHDTRIEDLQELMPEAMQLYQQALASGKRPNCRK
ncbi:M48 family metallopeptidase [Thiolapillus sp.]|uniref:M48 family metallopeptidase n=1 Tax=Thiolapillus sp. TaxID=2017437 RepID=UPI003AF9724C